MAVVAWPSLLLLWLAAAGREPPRGLLTGHTPKNYGPYLWRRRNRGTGEAVGGRRQLRLLRLPSLFLVPRLRPSAGTFLRLFRDRNAPRCCTMLHNAAQCATMRHNAPQCCTMLHDAARCCSNFAVRGGWPLGPAPSSAAASRTRGEGGGGDRRGPRGPFGERGGKPKRPCPGDILQPSRASEVLGSEVLQD